MSKILISSLGTGDKVRGYLKAKYQIDDKIYKNEEFIANALCTHLSIDKLFIVGTKTSIWDAVYKKFGGNEQNELKIYEAKEDGNIKDFLPLIEEQIDKHLGTKGSKCFIVNYGINEKQLWKNFEIYLDIAKNFAKNDKIYLDITHSFRSLSLMSFVMSEFISNINESPLKIKGVFYGILEYAKENNGITPIVDLSVFFELLSWSKAIRNLKLYGNSHGLLELIKSSNHPKELKGAFRDFSTNLSLSDMPRLHVAIKQLKGKLKLFKTSNNRLYLLIGDELEDFVKKLHVKSFSHFLFNLASWYKENHNYTFAIIVLAESIMYLAGEKYGLDTSNEWEHKKLKKLIQKDDIYPTYDIVRKKRNAIVHALLKHNGKVKKSISNEEAIARIDEFLQNTKDIFGIK